MRARPSPRPSARAALRAPVARGPAPPPAFAPGELEARVLYRDGLMLVIDKPAGLAVHGGPGGGDNLERYFDALRFGLREPPALAHRLDRDTSGCLVLGRQHKGLSRLGNLFSGGLVEKTYWAVVAGCPAQAEGRVDLALRKDTTKAGWRMTPDPAAGQIAVTDYRVVGRADGFSWLELKPHTGRTHQIRVHCAVLGCPILGEPLYGPAGAHRDGTPLHLLARAVSLPLYPKRAAVEVTAPVPAHMVAALTACGFAGEAPAATGPDGGSA